MNAVKRKAITFFRWLLSVLEKPQQPSSSEQTSSINSLAPKILREKADLDRVKPYLERLQEAIDTKDINNIAITGGYGSGKSTIIKTFENLHREYSYLNLSLASFNENGRGVENRNNVEENSGDKKGTNKDESLERRLEVSILQQMFYRVTPAKIPDSRFKRIVNVTDEKIFFLTVCLIVWILSALLLIHFDYIKSLNPKLWKAALPIDWVALISSIIFFIGIGLFIKNIYRLLRNSKISKLTIQGELELGEAVDKSVFNQHLEEILYFFERTDFNVVVIEDVDRFNCTDIFTKLREINVLINNSELIQRPVKFVYAIKDDMFLDKNERVKFFEYIIPIVPFINPSNANEQLTKLIVHANLQGVLSPDFTSDVVTFIDDIDMRLLINIFQEYQVYRNVLSTDLTQDNLFAILVYKNMYPDDFGELSKRRGKLYKFLTAKQTYLQSIKSKISDEIENIDNQLIKLEKESISNLEELRALYINHLVSNLSNFHAFYLEGNVSILEAVQEKNFQKIRASKNITYTKFEHYYSNQYHLTNNASSGVTFSSIENNVYRDQTYSQREKLVLDKTNNQVNLLKTEREKLLRQITELDALSIQEIFERIPIDPYIGEFKDSYLMRNLLLNGYVDEHFDDYISLFHEVTLTKDDFSFERSVKGGVSLPFDFALSKTENLIKRLPEKYFKREAILNFNLLASLLENSNRYRQKLDLFFQALRVDGEKQFRFIQQFIHTNPLGIEHFIVQICRHKPSLWIYVQSKASLPNEEVREFLRTVFEYADITDILQLEKVELLAKFLEDLPDFFAYASSFKHTRTLTKFIATHGIRFQHLDIPSGEQNDLFAFIYENNFYQINAHNIEAVIKGSGKDYDPEALATANYSTISNVDLEKLNRYIDANIAQYVKTVMTLLATNIREEEEMLVYLLNREDLTFELKKEIVASQTAAITSLSNIDDKEVKALVLSHNRLVLSWSNVFDYFDSAGEKLDDTLVGFLNVETNFKVLGRLKLSAVQGRSEASIEKIADSLLHGTGLTNIAYTHLLNAQNKEYRSIRYAELTVEKVDILLQKNRLILTSENFNGLKEKTNKLSTRLVEVRQHELEKTFDDLEWEPSDFVLLFQSSSLSAANKEFLIRQMDDSLIIDNSALAKAVGNVLPKDTTFPFRYKVLQAIIAANPAQDIKIPLLNLYLPSLNDEQVQELTEALGADYAKIFMKQHKPVFSNHPQHLRLFEQLRERGLIIRYELSEDQSSIRVFAKY